MFDTCHKKLWRLVNNVKSWQEKWEHQVLVEEVCVRGVRTSEYFVFPKICHKYFFEHFSLLIVCSHATSCTSCAKAKAAYKPFDMNKAQAKAKAETV